MSAKQSHLTLPEYGYDLVVATTEASINATMKSYLHSVSQKEVIVCYIIDEEGNPQEISYEELLKASEGSDPFRIPNDADPKTNQDLKNLANAYFLYAFKATIGLPPGYRPTKIPDIITLGKDAKTVDYRLLTSEFILTQASYGPRGLTAWLNKSQESGNAWIFTSKVDLRLLDTPDTEYSKLPDNVKKQVKNLGKNAFEVQQLLFDLDNAGLQSIPQISGVEAGTPLYNALHNVFLGAYFSHLKKNGEPVLAYSVVQPSAPHSSLSLSDLNLEVSPYVDADGKSPASPTASQQSLTSLAYLCATEGKPLAAAKPFSWNWVDESQRANFHGAIAINATTFRDWLNKQFSKSLTKICKTPHCVCKIENLKGLYALSFEPETKAQSYQPITISVPTHLSGGFTPILSFTYKQSDKATASLGSLACDYSVISAVYIKNNQIKVTTQVKAFVKLNAAGGVTKGNFAFYESNNLFTLAVDSHGAMVVIGGEPTMRDKSDNIKSNFWSKVMSGGTVDAVIKNEKEYVRDTLNSLLTSFAGTLQDYLNGSRGWVFPGGNTFAFKEVEFSEHNDLIAHITYLQP